MLLLHIGRGKTGSTSIQKSLLSNAELLCANGIILPDVSKKHGGNYAPLAPALQSESFNNSPVLDEFSSMLARFHDQKIIVSSEFLFELHPRAIAAIRNMANGHTVQVLAYLREYPSWFQSLYAQATQTGKNLEDFDSYFYRGWKNCSAVSDLTNWAEVFGWKNVRVRLLDPASLTGETLLGDLSSVLGVALCDIPYKNASPHWIEIEFIREIYNVDPELRKSETFNRDLRLIFTRLRACLNGISKIEAAYFSPRQWLALAKLYTEDVKLISQKMGVTLPVPRMTTPVDRPFLPTLAHAPKSICTRFFGHSPFWLNRHPRVRDAVATVLGAWSGNPSRYARLKDDALLLGGLASL